MGCLDVKQSLSRKLDSGMGLPMNEGQPPATREERLAARLRENLLRRKAQARAIERRDDSLPKAPERG